MSGHIFVATILGHHVSSLGIYFWVIKYKGKVLGWALLSLEYHIFNFFEIPNLYLILLQPTNEVTGRLCFAGVRDSVHRWGPSVPLHAGIHPQQVHLTPGTPPGRYTHPWQVHAPQVYLLVQCMLGYGQEGGGTHPTGMQSCYQLQRSCGQGFYLCL